ncbi:filaggrin-2-like [Diachasmimorpha longicaudata]|uniref:filaggrin-2-like n=1 Tax=Diachasmimorpha longicaudata TaxID=58733 RepID=UPI0030B8889F
MTVKWALIIYALVSQALGAPKPCYTNCGSSGSTYSHESITGVTGMSTQGSFMAQQNAAFQQLHQSLMNQLQEAHHLDYSQPGTWQKNAAYKTNDGGQVYQEHGKVETDNAQMRYFKKNYTKSWGTGGGLSNNLLRNQGHLSGGGYSSGSSHHENWEINSNGQNAQNIEDLGIQQTSTTQVSENVVRNFEEMANNLESYISQCSERVQMGQLSNYQSYTDVVQQHLDQMKQAVRDNGLWNRLIGQINSLETKLNELKVQGQQSASLTHTGSTSSHGSSSVVTSGVHQVPVAPVGGSIRQDEGYNRRISMTSHQTPIQTIPGQSQQYVSGTAGGYQQSYQYGSHGQSGQTGYVSGSQGLSSGGSQHNDYTQHAGYGQHDGRYSQQTGGYTQGHAGYNQAAADYTQGNVGYGQHNAGYSQHNAGYNQHNAGYRQHNTGYGQHNAGYNRQNAGYNQQTEQVYPVHTSPTKTVEESWNASGSRKETTYGGSHTYEPLRTTAGRCRGADGQYTWCSSNNGQTESIGYGGQGSGCQGAAYGTLCKRYKRETKDDFSQQTEDLTQQTEDLTQQTEDLTQQTEDLTQPTEDLTQQTEDLTQQTEDLMQQTEDLSQQGGNSRLNSQRRQQGGYGQNDQGGYGQNNRGGRDFNDQSGRIGHGHEQHGHNDGDQDYTQQTQNPGDFSQQHQQHGRGHGHGRVHGHEQHGHNDGDQDYTQQTQNLDDFSHQHQQHGHGHDHGRVHEHEQHGHNDGDQDYTQQTQHPDDFSHQHQHQQHGHGHHEHGVHGHEQHGHNDGDYGYNRQGGLYDNSQQQSRNVPLGQQQRQQPGGFGVDQQNHGSQGRGSYGGYSQQTEDLSQQTQDSEDLTQYSTQDLGFGQQTGNRRGNSSRSPGHSQQTEDLSQQTQSFGDWTQQTGDYGQQTEDLSQQTQSFGDWTQQTGNYGQQTEDLSQQTQSFGDWTQQTENYGQQTEDLSQQTTDNFGFEQQQTGNYGFGNQERDSSQQTQSFDDFTQQTTGNLGFENQYGNCGNYRDNDQQTEDLSQQTQSFGDLTQQTTDSFGFEQQQNTGSDFGSEQRDLNHQIQSFPGSSRGSGSLELGNERPAPKPPARGQIRSGGRGDSSAAQDTPMPSVKGGRRRPALQNTYPRPSQDFGVPKTSSTDDIELQQTTGTQWHNSHRPSDLTSENYRQGSPDGSQNPQLSPNEQLNTTDTETLFQPRILEAYGGTGPYDVNHNDNIFEGVKPNPTATLSPMSDSWDIRETSHDFADRNNNNPTFAGAPDRAPRHDSEETTTTTTPAPGFWKRVGNKIVTTYEKTKEKISSSLG